MRRLTLCEVGMPITRRELCGLLPVVVPVALEMPAFASSQEILPSGSFAFDKLPVEERDHAEIRHVMKGKLATGESVEVHESTLPPNGFPHAPHHHQHSELWLVRGGMVELTIEGQKHVLHAGDVGFVRSNQEHGIRNPGTETANYFVIAIGPGADTQA